MTKLISNLQPSDDRLADLFQAATIALAAVMGLLTVAATV